VGIGTIPFFPFTDEEVSMFTITFRSATESLLLEKFQALLVELNTVGDNTPYGHVLDDKDDLLFTAIRKLGNERLQHKLQERINNAEKQPESKQVVLRSLM
jgi:hypothetical protein